MCWTQAGDEAAAGSITLDGSPATIAGCACKIPSKIHNRPNPIRSKARPAGSAGRCACVQPRAPPLLAALVPAVLVVSVVLVGAVVLTLSVVPVLARYGSHSLMLAQAIARVARISSAMSPWCTSAARNAATKIGLAMFRPLFIPGIAVR